jgi:hypothetical protein
MDIAKLFRLRCFQDWGGEVASSNLVVPTIHLFLCFEQLAAEPILLFRTPLKRLLLMRSLWSDSLSLGVSEIIHQFKAGFVKAEMTLELLET